MNVQETQLQAQLCLYTWKNRLVNFFPFLNKKQHKIIDICLHKRFIYTSKKTKTNKQKKYMKDNNIKLM